MTDPLAAAIASRTPATTAAAIVDQVDAGRISAVRIGQSRLTVIDDTTGWRHEIGDPVVVEQTSRQATVRVIRPLAERPSQGVVASVSGRSAVVTAGGSQWNVGLVGTASPGDTVYIVWSGAGGLAALADATPEIRASMPPPAPNVETLSMPGLLADAPDLDAHRSVLATQSGTWRAGWDVEAGSQLTQGSMSPDREPARAVWMYGEQLAYLRGRIITAATLRVRRSLQGQTPATAVLSCHDAATTADDVHLVGEPWTGPVLLPGEEATITIPPDTLTPLMSGQASGLCLSGPDWMVLDGVTVTAVSGAISIDSYPEPS